MKYHLTLFAVLVAGLGLSGCARDMTGVPDGSGGVGRAALDLASDASLAQIEAVTRATVPGLTAPDADQFTLAVEQDASGLEVWGGDFADYPNDQLPLATGDYTATATFGDIDAEGFGLPCFGATTSFAILKDATTPVSMTATLRNMAVTVAYTDAFEDYFSDYSATISRSEVELAAFAADETRAAYIKPESFEIKVDYTLPYNGVSERTGFKTYTVSEHTDRATLHNITFDVAGDGAGKVDIIINFGDVVKVPLGTIDVGETEEEPEEEPQP